MAWYAELKRRRWYCICGRDMITYYKDFLWENLTDKEKNAILAAKRKEREKEKRKANTALLQLVLAAGILSDAASRTGRFPY